MEAQSLLYDLTMGDAATKKLLRRGDVHKRVWTAISEGYLNQEQAREFAVTRCTDTDAVRDAERRRYAVDPWGTSYWMYAEKSDQNQKRISVYSFGPNRRRDGEPGRPSGDDIAVFGTLRER